MRKKVLYFFSGEEMLGYSVCWFDVGSLDRVDDRGFDKYGRGVKFCPSVTYMMMYYLLCT
jgi:hypothetical protein